MSECGDDANPVHNGAVSECGDHANPVHNGAVSECGDHANPVHNGAVTVTDAQDTDHDIMMMIMMLEIAMVSLTDVNDDIMM